MKKRRFKEVDNAWDLADERAHGMVVATHQLPQAGEVSDRSETLSCYSRKRRQLKLNYKKLNRICQEMDVARGSGSGPASQHGIKEQSKIMGKFAIIMYDFEMDYLYQLPDTDQAVIREQLGEQRSERRHSTAAEQMSAHMQTTSSSYDSVDSIRFLKTNVGFYERAMLVWLKFKLLNEQRLERAAQSDKTLQFGLLQDFQHFLRGFLMKAEKPWAGPKEQGLLTQTIDLVSSVILSQHF